MEESRFIDYKLFENIVYTALKMYIKFAEENVVNLKKQYLICPNKGKLQIIDNDVLIDIKYSFEYSSKIKIQFKSVDCNIPYYSYKSEYIEQFRNEFSLFKINDDLKQFKNKYDITIPNRNKILLCTNDENLSTYLYNDINNQSLVNFGIDILKINLQLEGIY